MTLVRRPGAHAAVISRCNAKEKYPRTSYTLIALFVEFASFHRKQKRRAEKYEKIGSENPMVEWLQAAKQSQAFSERYRICGTMSK